MAFFGVELKAAKPYSHRFDTTRGRLHISHATLGIGTSTKKCFVQCNVGNKSPILLCSLTPGQSESCSLDLEFEEEEEVIFSVIGPSSVYLTGYYLGNTCSHGGDGDESDSYGEDIAETDSGESSYYDSDEDEYEDDFIDDDDDDDLEMYSGSPQKSGVVIEEIIDEKPVSENGDRKRLKKKYVSDSDGDNQKQLVVRGSDGLHLPESEDEDGLPIHSNLKSKSDKKASKKKAAGGSDQVTGSKRKMDAATQDGEPEKETDQPKDTVEIEHESSEKPKKKKRKERAKEAKEAGAGDDTKIDVPKQNSSQAEEATANDNPEQIQAVRDEQDEKLSNGKMLDVDSDHKHDDAELKTKKKKKKKAKKISDDTEDAKKDSIVENEEKNEELKPSQARTFSNGLVVEELQMGKPDGKRASAGSKVFVNYIGKLKKNGAIFDSNIGRAPFKFRLGIGEVIKGWDVGVNGMRIGDKRRITIPPSMGYGAKGAGGKIPPHAWLVFDVELVDVR